MNDLITREIIASCVVLLIKEVTFEVLYLQVQVYHDGTSDFPDPPVNVILGGEDADGLPVYVGTRYDEQDPALTRPMSIHHDGTRAFMPKVKSDGAGGHIYHCLNMSDFHFLVLQIGKEISFIRSFIHSFVHSFVRSVIQSVSQSVSQSASQSVQVMPHDFSFNVSLPKMFIHDPDVFPNEASLQVYTDKGQCPPSDMMPSILTQDKVPNPGGSCPCSDRRYTANLNQGEELSVSVCPKCGGSVCHRLDIYNISVSQESMTGPAAYVRSK